MPINELENLLACPCINGRTATIIESDPSAITKRVTIEGLKAGFIVMLVDSGRNLTCSKCNRTTSQVVTPLFKTGPNIKAHKLVDAIILAEKAGGKFDVIFLDLKSNSPGGFTAQFVSTECFLAYALHVLKEFHNKSLEIVRTKYVLLQPPVRGGALYKQPIGKVFNKKSTPGDPVRLYRPDQSKLKISEILSCG